MTTLDLRSGGVDIRGHVGDDLVVTATIVDSNGSAVDVSGYTISADVLRDGTSIASFSDSVGGAGNNVVTLSLTDTQTSTIGIEAGLRWSLSMTTGGTTRQYVGGAFRLSKAGDPNASSATSVTVTTEGAAISVTVAAGGGGASALDDLNDVTITTPSSGQVLKYNGSIWVNDTDATAGGSTALDDLSDVAITTAAEGDILRRNATEFVNTPGTTHYEAAGAVAAHEADTTNVHGIADTSALLDAADIGVFVQAHSAVLDATTASFTTADESKLDGIEAAADVTDATNVAAAGAVMSTLVDAKGDIIVATADNTVTRLPVGTNDYVLTADSAEASGVKWAAAAGGGFTANSVNGVIAPSLSGWNWAGPPAASFTTHAFVLTRAYYMPISIDVACRITGLAARVTTASSTGIVRIGVYTDSNGLPSSLVSGSEVSMATTSTGVIETTGLTVDVTAGRYWVAFVAQTDGATFQAYTLPNAHYSTSNNLYVLSSGASAVASNIVEVISGALPSSATPVDSTNATNMKAPIVAVQIGATP